MSNLNEKPEDFAARALELLEQCYAYYQMPLQPVTFGKTAPETATYYEYVKAA